MVTLPWRPIGALIILASLLGYAIHFDPWKNSVLFQRLLAVAAHRLPMPIDLLSNHEPILLSAADEANALLRDDFKYQDVGTPSSVVICNNWVFPSDKPARFTRDGSILRGDNFVYAVEIYVDDLCSIRKADGRTGPVPFL